jgi:hypothetical protein
MYCREWFKERAFSSLKRIDDHTWDFSDSLLLYISPSATDTYEAMQETDTPYYKMVTKPEREYLEAIAENVVKKLPDNFEYIDLGPGTEHKEQFFFDELKKQGKKFTYIPVDISQYYLDLSEKHAAEQGIPVKSIQASFEELADRLGSPKTPRFVNIGLTFSNYKPSVILSSMKDIAGPGGFLFINAHMSDRTDMDVLQEVYALDAKSLADEKLVLIGLDPERDVTPRTADKAIQVWGTVIHSNDPLREMGVTEDDKLLLFQSLRYTKDSLENVLRENTVRYHLFDTGAAFIAALIDI